MTRRVVLTRSWTNSLGKTYPIGQIIQGTKELCSELIGSGVATSYGGKYPPIGKVKTDLFKPKTADKNERSKRK